MLMLTLVQDELPGTAVVSVEIRMRRCVTRAKSLKSPFLLLKLDVVIC